LRRPNRNIEIFSISALDLFASALGAFILVAIILFPYYLKDQDSADKLATAKTELSRAKAEAEQALAAKDAALRQVQNELSTQATKLETLQRQLEQAHSAQGKAFLVVGIRWTTPAADVDLHVTDPSGNEFYWFKNNANRRDFASSSAELSYDMTSGPAVELWQDPAAAPGEYTVDYVANALPEGYTVEVFGTVFDRNGRHDLPAKTLRKAKERVRGAVLNVGGDGRVAIR
jgi:hypothetical protein